MHVSDRFGPDADGKRRLLEVLCRHSITENDSNLAQVICDSSQVLILAPQTTLMVQDGQDNDIYFIVFGSVRIEVNRRKVASRVAGQHVGEMALIDLAARRSATVITEEDSVVLKLSESDFSIIANSFPDLWRRLARELSTRLRQRNSLVKSRNERARVFIGCSSEALAAAQAIQMSLEHRPFDTVIWTDGIFKPSTSPMESLERELERSDFGVLLLTADDVVASRGVESRAPRDNVIFELGMWIGALGRSRTFFIQPRNVDLRLPSDIIGLTPLTYDPTRIIESRFAGICSQLAEIVALSGPK